MLAIVGVLGVQHFLRNQRTYELNLPVHEDTVQIVISRDSDSITISDVTEIKDIIGVIGGVKRHTTKDSIQDIPTSADNRIQVDIYGTDENAVVIFVWGYRNFGSLEINILNAGKQLFVLWRLPPWAAVLYARYRNKLCTRTLYNLDDLPYVRVTDEYM